MGSLALQIWKVNTPPRKTFFAWEAVRECILTIDKLMRMGHIMLNGCYLCKDAVESYNHLLLWCPVTYSIWYMVYGLLGIDWIIGSSVKYELWARDGVCKKLRIVNPIQLTTFWAVWKERNNRAFDEYVEDLSRIRDRWIHSFGTLILRYDLYGWDDFRKVFYALTNK